MASEEEKKIMQGNVKLTVFEGEFPLTELEKIRKAFDDLGYDGVLEDNGNIVFQKRVKGA
jgi:hypothetical protein